LTGVASGGLALLDRPRIQVLALTRSHLNT
jgi:hypothetical protein